VTGLLQAYVRSFGDFFRTIVAQRRLLAALAKRDLSDQYVSHRFSLTWTIIQPLFLMVVYLFVFTKVFPSRVKAPPGLETDAITYLLSGIIPWLALSQVMTGSLASIVNNTTIVKQMAFPLELLPIKALAGPLLFSGVSLVVLIGYGLWVTGGVIAPAYLIGLPALLFLSLVLFAGLSLILSCLQVFFRDLKEFVGMFLTIGLFIHPILYFPDAMPVAVRPLIYASPFSYYLFCWQDIFFFGGFAHPSAWVITFAFSLVVFVVGARLFVISKPHFGDFL
jgi:lipopolysaccharide transport system permease protein